MGLFVDNSLRKILIKLRGSYVTMLSAKLVIVHKKKTPAALLKVFAFILQPLAFSHRHHLGHCGELCIFELIIYLPH